MIKVKFRGKIWIVLCPKNLIFPKGCVRNILIERTGYGIGRVITHIKELERIGNYDMEGFL